MCVLCRWSRLCAIGGYRRRTAQWSIFCCIVWIESSLSSSLSSSTSLHHCRSHWLSYAALDPFIAHYIALLRNSKRDTWLGALQHGVVQQRAHPRWLVLKRNGRAGCETPNVQAAPRNPGHREVCIMWVVVVVINVCCSLLWRVKITLCCVLTTITLNCVHWRLCVKYSSSHLH